MRRKKICSLFLTMVMAASVMTAYSGSVVKTKN